MDLFDSLLEINIDKVVVVYCVCVFILLFEVFDLKERVFDFIVFI